MQVALVSCSVHWQYVRVQRSTLADLFKHRQSGNHRHSACPTSLGLCSTPSATTMPSDQSTWLISVPLDGDSEGLLEELAPKLAQQAKLPVQDIAQLQIPSFKVWVTLVDVTVRSNATVGRLAPSTRLSRSLRIYRSKTLSLPQQSQRASTRSGTS